LDPGLIVDAGLVLDILLVLGLLLGSETLIQVLVLHFGFHALASVEFGYGLIDGADELAHSGALPEQDLAMRAKRFDAVEARTAHDGLNLLELEAELAKEQDLLEREQLVIFVIPILVLAHARRL